MEGMDSAEERLVLALRALNSELAGSNRVVASRLGLNESDLAVLDVLHRDGPQTPTVLARRTRMSPTTMTSVLRRLARDGWVERKLSATDLRSFTIHPTSIDRLAVIFRPADQQLADLIADWPAAQIEALIAFLNSANTVIQRQTDELANHPDRPRNKWWPHD
jgi:DNA-binding MarR family transcriptional regulator